ncbi:UNVERIFIED_CONTAM: hypothetical protein Sangu_0384500 [Sesamum angustifolium]|uniref:Uncharacterized protein n=1 Tax=Sesamum angustifolium TaxID=2727405 RepID=A0AAW2QS41_9LAMI
MGGFPSRCALHLSTTEFLFSEFPTDGANDPGLLVGEFRCPPTLRPRMIVVLRKRNRSLGLAGMSQLKPSDA